MVRPILDTRTKRNSGLYPIYIEKREEGRRKLFPVGFSIEKKFWSGSKVRPTHPQAVIINAKISLVATQALVEITVVKETRLRLIDIISKKADDYQKKDKIIMWRKIQRLITEIEQFSPGVYLDQINEQFVNDFDTFLFKNGNSDTTRSKKMKLYGFVIGGDNAFRKKKIRENPTHKIKLTLEEFNRIATIQLAGQAAVARDIFLFSYYCKGQRFSDCIMCKWDQIRSGRIYFTQEKTGKNISVKIHPRLEMILNMYKSDSRFIFPYVKTEPKSEIDRISVVGTYNTIVNRYLKVISALTNTLKFGFHTARHTFAYHLMQGRADIHVIREAMGHSNYKTTQIYLDSLGDETLDDEMNRIYGE